MRWIDLSRVGRTGQALHCIETALVKVSLNAHSLSSSVGALLCRASSRFRSACSQLGVRFWLANC